MEIIRMTAQGMQPKSIARIENCSVKTVYTIGVMLRPSCTQKYISWFSKLQAS
ncbi:putative fimbrial transcriptional regulator [Escherichia coli]|uniref:Putative fimbrial transcriptional regulator n=1 Tax=Escherichia coli TaxID=562 RepID=A0A376P105_ECOLX|nr:putative fimbrial transcriptional regulator [Escherichia coli]